MNNVTEANEIAAVRALAHLHHAYLLGLQLMISSQRGPDVMADWMFRLFRRQHLDKFLSSFEKLGLDGLPDAVACAKYHVLSNGVGGVSVEYIPESDTKAWVRFRYPRWMYHGPTICGVPVGVSRGFLKGWYAHNGVSLKNPRLGYVCVSEDMTGEFGLCGYFREYDHDLTEDERLQFAKDELPPPSRPEEQPELPSDQWNELRLEKANRNYALDYIRNGLTELVHVIGEDDVRELAMRAARLIGLQYFEETRETIGAVDGDINDAGAYLATMFSGMGDETRIETGTDSVTVHQSGLRVIRGLPEAEAALVFDCWSALWQGTGSSQQVLKSVGVTRDGENATWEIRRQTTR